MPGQRNGPWSGLARSALPLAGQPPVAPDLPPSRRERADAVRNREKVLAAAAALFAERGVGAVSMEDVAHRAGVGKGTVFRRFGDKGRLAAALLDEQEKRLQAAVLSGPPPLGPGAEPARRLEAFLDAYLDYALPNVELVRMSETSGPGARYRIGAYGFWWQHVALLVAELRPDDDAAALAHVLLAPVAADLLEALPPPDRDRHRAALRLLARQLSCSR